MKIKVIGPFTIPTKNRVKNSKLPWFIPDIPNILNYFKKFTYFETNQKIVKVTNLTTITRTNIRNRAIQCTCSLLETGTIDIPAIATTANLDTAENDWRIKL